MTMFTIGSRATYGAQKRVPATGLAREPPKDETLNLIARKHHYNPALLLAGFTPSGRKSDHLWAFDARIGRAERRTPRAVGWEMDYYTVDIPDQPPDLVETLFSKVETRAARAIRRIRADHRLPARESGHFEHLMSFVALMFIRGPKWREFLLSLELQPVTSALQMMLATPKHWAAAEKAMRNAGLPDRNISYEQLREFVDRRGFDFKVTNPGPIHAKYIVESLRWLPGLLAKRNWGLMIAEPGVPDFISSDTPVSIVWTDPAPAALSPPGLGYIDTELAMALHRRVALVARYEPVDTSSAAGLHQVTDINFRTAANAHRFVYGPSESFSFLAPDGGLLSAADWFRTRSDDLINRGGARSR